MKCSKCGHENRTGAKFCEECAAPLARTCPNCGNQVSATAKFCPECAHPIGKASEVLQPPSTSPESYTPKYLAEKILISKSALEGERKQVTVLFVDLKGSMELLSDRDPEEARKLLDPVLEVMMEAVHRYEGTVNQVMGDGIMALFGAPVAHEDHAVRACYAAVRIQRRINLYADEVQRKGGTPVQIRAGLNSGEVVVRSIHSDLRMDYSAVGQTTHLAARLEQIAKAGSILVTNETLKLAEGYIQVRPLGVVPIKGLDQPIDVYEVTGIGAARSRLQATAARGLTRFVGRDSEIQQLVLALERTAVGHGQIVAIVGEAGVGKSRLVWEFTHSHRTHGWLILESASVSYGTATPYLPVIELLKSYFRIQNHDDHREIRDRVAGKLLMLDRALEPMLLPLFALLDVPVTDATWEAFDPAQRRQRTLDAIKRLLLRESQVQPLLLIFEDLHWVDSGTQFLLDMLIESLPSYRVILLVNYRPEYQHSWGNKTYYRQLKIDPLPPESAEELLDALLGTNPNLDLLKRLLVERTEGNPFFLEESVRSLVETQVLTGERGAYRLERPVQSLRIPTTAQAILAARIDRLVPDNKRLLQTASVIGKNVPFTLLQAVAEESEDHVRQGLTQLQAAEFLYEARLYPDVEYTFRHALTHEVALGSLLQDRRRVLHARIVEALEALYPERLTEHIEQLAHHAFRGEVWEKAMMYLRQAAGKAFERSSHRQSATFLEEALVALGHLADTPATREQAVDMRIALRNSLWPLGDFETGLGHLRNAEQLAKKFGDQRRLGWISAYMSEHARQTAHSADAPVFAERAQTIAEEVKDFPLRIAANYYLGTAYFASGRYGQADPFFSNILRLLEGDLKRERCGLAGFPAVMSRAFWAWALAERGEFQQGITHAEEGVRLAETLDHPYSLTFACKAVGHLHGTRGEVSRAIPLAERGLAVCREWNLVQLLPEVTDVVAYLYVLSGRVSEGLSLLRDALIAMESMGHFQWRSPLIVHLSEAYLLAGQLEEALTLATKGLILARERGHRGSEAWELRLLAEIASHHDRPDVATAQAHYGEAVALASELGMRPLVAHCHLGLCKLYRQTGNREQARELLTKAITMYREMSMQSWLQKAETEMRELG